MANELLIQFFVAFVIVPLSSWLKNVTWDPKMKTLLVAGISLIFGIATTLLDGKFDPMELLPSMSVIFTVSTLYYKLYFEHTQLNRSLEAKKVL